MDFDDTGKVDYYKFKVGVALLCQNPLSVLILFNSSRPLQKCFFRCMMRTKTPNCLGKR